MPGALAGLLASPPARQLRHPRSEHLSKGTIRLTGPGALCSGLWRVGTACWPAPRSVRRPPPVVQPCRCTCEPAPCIICLFTRQRECSNQPAPVHLLVPDWGTAPCPAACLQALAPSTSSSRPAVIRLTSDLFFSCFGHFTVGIGPRKGTDGQQTEESGAACAQGEVRAVWRRPCPTSISCHACCTQQGMRDAINTMWYTSPALSDPHLPHRLPWITRVGHLGWGI